MLYSHDTTIQIYGYVKNVRMCKTFIGIGIRKTLETLTTLGCSGTKLLLPSWLIGFQYEERGTQILLCWLFHLIQQCAAHLVDPTGLASLRLRNQLASPRSKSQLTAFFSKNHQKSSAPVLFRIQGFYYDICDCHIPPRERKHLRSMCASTRALSRIVLSLTKPKDQI